ncbi:SPOR domain-containing protein [Ewingella sp. S1.OA.A_B6]
MDDLTPEDDLKPDTSDRRPPRSRKPASSAPKLAVSRQHLMIGVGILVLLLLIVGIGSALKTPTQHEVNNQPSNGPKDINLSGSGNDAAAPAQPSAQAQTNTAQANNNGQQVQQNVGMPPISSTPTDAQPQPDNTQSKERVDLPGDMSDALSSQQGQVNAAVQEGVNAGTQSLTSLPTAPATVDGAAKGKAPVATRTPQQTAHTKPTKTHAAATAHESKKSVQTKPATAASHPAKETTKPVATASAATGSGSAIKSAPGGHFTLQLSGASQSNSLNAFAKQQGLKNYLVYQTSRDGKPWFVLVSGNYASSAEAKNAISSLPAEVQAKKPWVKPVHQVQQDLKK